MEILSIDVGGSSMKGAVVNTITGELLTEKLSVETPKDSTPENMSQAMKTLVKDKFGWSGNVGCSFPTIVKNGVAKSYGNIDPSWLNVAIDKLFEQACPDTKFYVGNDADLAGIAELKFGAGIGLDGKVLMVTIGTGLGTGIFYDGVLVPNIEFGRILYTDGNPIEFYAAGSAVNKDNLNMEQWAKRFNYFLNHVDRISSPDHFIISGGITQDYEQFKDFLDCEVPIYLAKYREKSGIVGAGIFAEKSINRYAKQTINQ